jgi:hypothetical protein
MAQLLSATSELEGGEETTAVPSTDMYIYSYLSTDADVTGNSTNDLADYLEDIQHFESVVRDVVSVIFGLIALLGLVGNLSVIIVVMANNSMRSTTNILIIGLAIADLVFIIVCVPFTALSYVLTVWPFGDLTCKVRLLFVLSLLIQA